jgi:hypothetical protein
MLASRIWERALAVFGGQGPAKSRYRPLLHFNDTVRLCDFRA